MAHHPPWGGVGGGCHPDRVHGAPSWVVGLQHPCNNPLAVVCVLPQVPHQMAGSAKSVSALQHAGAAAGPAAQQAGPRPPPEPPPRRREHRIAPPTQGLPRRRPGGTRRQPKHYGTSTEGQARTRAAGRGALYGGGHVPTGRSGRAPRPKNLPPRSCAGMKGLALEPGLDSSPWGDEGDSGSSAGARTTSFFQHIPSSCTTSAGKRRGTRRSSIEPPEGAPTASCNTTTFPPPPSQMPRYASQPCCLPPPRHATGKNDAQNTVWGDGGPWSIMAGSCPVLLFALILTGLPLPSQSLPGKLGLGAATPGFVPRLGASSAPAAPPKGLTGVGKPALPPGDGRVVVAWGLPSFGYPHSPSPSPSSARWATSAGPSVPPMGAILARTISGESRRPPPPQNCSTALLGRWGGGQAKILPFGFIPSLSGREAHEPAAFCLARTP